jgi:predicted aspartyl protease|tara:strand:- start:357 stop:1337 length:981 start_codon:yes stop_codon:yes gene_type:complete
MKKLLLLVWAFSISGLGYSQGEQLCENEVIEQEGYYFSGCTNYEGQPDGKGYLKKIINDQKQEFQGLFKNGVFKRGTLLVSFGSGDTSLKNYDDYNSELLSSEIYVFANGNKIETIYESGIKVKEIQVNLNGDSIETIFKLGSKFKEIQTFGDSDSKGLIIERVFENNNIIESRNIDNNRVVEDIIGGKDYIDVDLIKDINKFRIPIEFPTKSGNYIKVPILFDTGATTFLIGHKLYEDLIKKCEIVDMQVKGKLSGVGSSIETKYIKIDKIKIGEYLVKNVIAIVPLSKGQGGKKVNDILIGIGFLKKFKDVEWSLNNNKMRFYK